MRFQGARAAVHSDTAAPAGPTFTPMEAPTLSFAEVLLATALVVAGRATALVLVRHRFKHSDDLYSTADNGVLHARLARRATAHPRVPASAACACSLFNVLPLIHLFPGHGREYALEWIIDRRC